MSANNSYKIEFTTRALKEDYPRLPKAVREMIDKAIETRLAFYPLKVGKRLKYELSGSFSLRVSKYRIVYRVEEKTVIIDAVDHRAGVYD